MRNFCRSLGLSLLVALAACRQSPEPTAGPVALAAAPVAPNCELTVGWDPWEPYQYEAADGRLQGLDIELIRTLAREAGCSLAFVQGHWVEHLDALREGRIDLLLAATPNEQRQTFAVFTSPYRDEDMAMFVRKEDAESLTGRSLAELVAAGHRVAVTDGYYYGPEVASLMADEDSSPAFSRARIVESGYLRLVEGQVDVLLDDPVVAASVLRRKGWTDEVVRHPLDVSHSEVALMFSRQSVPTAVVRRFEAALQRARASGGLEAVVARYAEPRPSGS